MKTMVIWELIIIGIACIIRYFYKKYQRHKDKNKVKTVLNYLQHRTGNIEVEKLQKMLGVENNEIKDKSKQK